MTTLKKAFEENCTVIDLNRTSAPSPAEWELMNLSGYDVRRYKNYLIFDEMSAGQLEDILHNSAIDNNNLSLPERINFGARFQGFFLEKYCKEAEEFGYNGDVVGMIQEFGYWSRYNLNPSKADVVKALCGIGKFGEQMQEIHTLGLLEDIARRYFDDDSLVVTEDELTEEEA